MKKSLFMSAAIISACLWGIASINCGGSNTAQTTIVEITGKLPVLFTWHDGITSCAECAQIIIVVNTSEKGDFDYDPFPFSFGGVTINHVLAGFNRTVIVSVTNSTGEVIYHGSAIAPKIVAGKTNDPLTIELFSRGWYKIYMNQPSTTWVLFKVRMTSSGNGWMVGRDGVGPYRGFVYRGIENSWGLQLPTVSTSNDWWLNSIDGAGSTAWAVGADSQNKTGIILRYDGAIWNENVGEPTISNPWVLRGVSFASDGIGWAVGENTPSGAKSGPVVLRYAGSWLRMTEEPAGSISLYDVFALSGGGALIVGKNNTTNKGYIAQWDEATTTYQDGAPTPPDPCNGSNWDARDIYAVSAGNWWAAGTCYDPPGSGVTIHYNGTSNVENPTGPAGNWGLYGIWANASGEAWAVGYGDNGAVILSRSSGGTWSVVTPEDAQTSWRLYSVDFSADEMWGYAVGEDTTTHLGLVLKYPFPQ